MILHSDIADIIGKVYVPNKRWLHWIRNVHQPHHIVEIDQVNDFIFNDKVQRAGFPPLTKT